MGRTGRQSTDSVCVYNGIDNAGRGKRKNWVRTVIWKISQ